MKFIFLILIFLVTTAFTGPVSYYGELKASGYKLLGSKTESAAQVRGVSFFWSQWGNSFYNSNAVNRLVEDWKVEVIRAAYGSTSAGFNTATAAQNRAYIDTLIQAAIENDIYVIIDWHSHSAQNEVELATAFFSDMAQRWGNFDNVIFELYNEPVNVEWKGIKDYAEVVIDTIRKYSDNLILVGTPQYDQKIEQIIGNTINDPNVGYVLHFYAASHPLSSYRTAILSVLGANLPLFVTEYGTTNADGGNPDNGNYNSHNSASVDEWLAFLDSKKISSAAWSVFDKYEGSAFFGLPEGQGSFDQTNPANWSDTNKMSPSGKYLFKKLNDYAKSAPWNSTPILIANENSINTANGQEIFGVYSLNGSFIGYFDGKLSGFSGKKGIYILKSANNVKKNIYLH